MIHAGLHTNGDDCFLAWSMPPAPNCWGFAISRDLKTAGGKKYSGYIHNWVGFEGDANPPHSHKPSNEWPFQRYTWTDHGVSEGDTVSYEVAPVLATPDGLTVDRAGSAKVGPVSVTTAGDRGVSAYFNRGILLSQFMARRLGSDFTKGDLAKVKSELKKNDNPLRHFLMGQLGARLLELLGQAKDEGWEVYAALYELEDEELVNGLKALKKRAHVVLANGSKKKKGTDGNVNAAKVLNGVVDLSRRMLWSEGLGHNKFVVFAKASAKPSLVWTGSTNWASTGLCTQLNNGVLIQDAALAKVYKEQWQLLKDDRRVGRGGADMHFGTGLMASNDKAKASVGNKKKGWTVWFTRTSAAQDMDALAKLINGAKKAILFLMFEPGNSGLLQVIQARLSPAAESFDPDLYVQGVVNTIKPAKDQENVRVELVQRGRSKPFDLRVIQPEGMRDGLAGWAAEVTRRDFLLGQGGLIGHAIIHSKIIVIDPFTDPIVITGSHNFSPAASSKNDENVLVVRGNAGLAERYAVNIMGVYQHYRWRSYLQQCAQNNLPPWDGLKKNAEWQNKKAEHDPELQFWIRG